MRGQALHGDLSQITHSILSTQQDSRYLDFGCCRRALSSRTLATVGVRVSTRVLKHEPEMPFDAYGMV